MFHYQDNFVMQMAASPPYALGNQIKKLFVTQGFDLVFICMHYCYCTIIVVYSIYTIISLEQRYDDECVIFYIL